MFGGITEKKKGRILGGSIAVDQVSQSLASKPLFFIPVHCEAYPTHF